MGDFNFPDILWQDCATMSSSNSISSQFLNAVQDSFLTLRVMLPTRHQANQQSSPLDLVITNDPNFIDNIRHIPPLGSSDHECLAWNFTCYNSHVSMNNSVKIYNYFKGNYVAMNNYFDGIDWSIIFQDDNTHENYNIFLEYILSAVENFIPKTNPHVKTKNTLQWWTKSLSKAIKLKHSFFPNGSILNSPLIIKDTYATQCNLVKAKVRSAQVKFEETLIQHAQTKPKLLYGYIKAKQKVKASIGSLQKANGCFTLDDYNTAEELNNFLNPPLHMKILIFQLFLSKCHLLYLVLV